MILAVAVVGYSVKFEIVHYPCQDEPQPHSPSGADV